MTDADTVETGTPRRRVYPWPPSPLDWLKIVAGVCALLMVAVAAVQYVGYLERQRCRDAIVGRHDIRTAFPEVVAYIVARTSPEPEQLAPVIEGVGEIMADEYGHPACARRWGIDPIQVLRDRGEMDPADPLVADALGVDPVVWPTPGERPRGG